MKTRNVKMLAVKLATAENEETVVSILKDARLWDKPELWRDYGGQANNWSVAGNQQGRPETALVEKLINSIDSVSIAECMKAGINPEGPKAPPNTTKAVELLFGVPRGKLSNLTPTERTAMAERIWLVATGERGSSGRACYAIFDAGEGQTPRMFENTFLSIGKTNKIRIPFVQGKFNMGGTGALEFWEVRFVSDGYKCMRFINPTKSMYETQVIVSQEAEASRA